MASGAAQDNNVAERRNVRSAVVNDEELKPFVDAVRTLPANAVKDLLSLGVCYCCITALFGCHEHICSRPSLPNAALAAIFQEVLELEGDEVVNGSIRDVDDSNGQQLCQEFQMKQKVCTICLGILQFVHLGDNGVLVMKDCASDYAATIVEALKREHHQINSFSLEVSLPPLVMEKEKAIWLYMKNKCSSEPWFQELSTSEHAFTKDVLKMSITETLEALLGVKSTVSPFRIRLMYTHNDASLMVHDTKESNGCNKRRKTGACEDFGTTRGCVVAGLDSSDIIEGEKYATTKTFSKELQVHGVDNFMYHLEKVNQPCCLTYLCHRNPIFIGGRYLKFSRNVSQTRWIIDDERMGEASVEEIIGSNILPICGGDSYKFHAAGREDIDVRMLGTGRPFLVEIQNARQVPSEVLIKEIEMGINSLESKLVRVKNLKSLESNGWDMMREGEAEKQKQYAALVWISRPLNDGDMQTISSLKDMQILQKTPVRVLHRRSPLEREKIIHWMRIEKIAGSSQYFLLHLCTQAGTYIKEFVHSDLGRTHPSVGSILGCRAEILQLDVTDVKMDCFQDE